MKSDGSQTDYQSLISAAIEAQMAFAARADAVRRVDETAAARLDAAETAHANQIAWATEQTAAVTAAAAEGLTRAPQEVALVTSPTPPAIERLAPDTRAGLADARRRTDLSLKELRDLAGALRLWQLQRSKLLRVAAVGLIVLLAVGGLTYAVRAALGRSAEEAAATQTAVAAVAETDQTKTPTPTATAEAGHTATPTPTATSRPAGEEETEPVVVEEPTSTATPDNVTPVAGGARTANRGGVIAEQVFVPAGSFRMGTNGGGDDERPVHDVSVDAFWIDRTEVTNAQFEAFVAATGLETTAERNGQGSVYALDSWEPVAGADLRHPQGPGSAAEPAHPVVLVTWEEAGEFCAWAGGRLPTEAEWEYAARGPESLPFPWGISRDPTLFNSCDANCPYPWRDVDVNDGYAHTAPVGSYPGGASWVGALDMVGNVWEWVSDWFNEDTYTEAPRVNPTGPNSGALRVIRGAAWVHEPGIHYAANRGRGFPGVGYNGFGFRCAAPAGSAVATIPQPPPPSVTPATCPIAPASRWATTLWSAYRDQLGCARFAERRPNGAFQYYQNGTMLWREDAELVHVLYHDGTLETYNALAGPEGYFDSALLKGAFGYLWNNNQSVRDRIGEPLTVEYNATDLILQEFDGGTIFSYQDNGTHEFVLFNDSRTWH